MGRAFVAVVLAACGTSARPPTAEPLHARGFVAPTVAAVGEPEREVPYVEPPPADWSAPPSRWTLPHVPESSTSYAKLEGFLAVARDGSVLRGDRHTPLPDEIDPRTLLPPPAPVRPPLPIATTTGNSGSITSARSSGVLGASALLKGGDFTYTMPEPPKLLLPERTSGRVSQWGGNTIGSTILLIADRDAPVANVLAELKKDVLGEDGAFAVSTPAGLRAFRMTFGGSVFGLSSDAPAPSYLQIELAATTLRATAIVANVPAPAVLDAALADRASIIALYKRATTMRKLGRQPDVWIQLRDGVTVGRFLELVDALVGAGVTGLEVSNEPPIAKPPDIPKLELGPLQSTISWPYHRGAVKRALLREAQKLVYCYEKALLVNPGLAGSLSLSFDLDDIGAVLAVRTDGIDPDVARCVAGVVKGMSFPRPNTNKVTITTSLTFRRGA